MGLWLQIAEEKEVKHTLLEFSEFLNGTVVGQIASFLWAASHILHLSEAPLHLA
jgi:hypothetical protein